MNFKKFLTTAAVITMTATGAYVAGPAPYAAAATVSSGYIQQANQDDRFASDLIGASIYDSDQPNAQSVGDINDLLVAPDGTVDAVVIGVGGFLGVGEKDVAVPFDAISWKTDANGKPWPVLVATKEDLNNAPAFRRDNQTAMSQALKDANQQPVPKDQTMNDQAAGNQPAKQGHMNEQAAGKTAMTPPKGQVQAYDASLVSADDLINTTVYDANGDDIGKVGDVLMTDKGKIDAVVLDIGGFLGIGAKPVAIAFKDLRIAQDQNKNLIIQTAFTRDQLNAAPEYSKDKYTQNRDQVLVKSNNS